MLTQKNQKNQSLHQNRQIGIGFLVFFGFLKFPNWHWFFLFFFGFFWPWFWPEFEIGNWFFWFFLGFFGFFLVFLGFFVFLAFDFRVEMSSQKKPKKN